MNAALACLLCCLAAADADAAPAGPPADGSDGIVRIDFGTESSPVRPGWLRVTHKTRWGPGVRAGWADANGLAGRNNPVPREWAMSRTRGYKRPPPIYTTDIRQDCVVGRESAELRIRVPAGRYRLWYLTGSAGGSGYQVWNIRLPFPNGIADINVSGRYAARTYSARRDVEGDVLALPVRTRSRWNLCALAVVPEAKWEAARPEIEALDREAKLLPPDVLAKWKEQPPELPPPPGGAFQAGAEDRKRGFAVFARPWVQPVWPNDIPGRDEMNPGVLRIFACPGEDEPLTISIHALADLPSLHFGAGGLDGPGGAHIRIRPEQAYRVRAMHVRPNYRTYGTYYRAPDLLWNCGDSREQGPGEGTSRRYWVNVSVPETAMPGTYRGHVAITGGGPASAAVRIPVELRVLPIKLQKDRSLVYGTYYRHPYDRARRAPDEFSRRWWTRKAECEFRDMARHGLNAWVGGVWGRMSDGGKWLMDFDHFGRKIDLARRHGLDKPIICHIPTSAAWRRHMKEPMGSHLRLVKRLPPKGFFDDITRLVRTIEKERRRRQWPELLYYPIDEPGRHPAAVRLMVETLKAIRRVAGVRTYVTADPAHEAFAPMRPHVDVWCCQPFSVPREQVLADAKKGIEYWCYPNHVAGENDHTPAAGARMTYGFGLWRSGFKALTPWIYQAVIGDPLNYLDGSAMDFFNRTGDDGAPIPCVLWEAYREGIDDYRYVTTLTRWIDRARELGLDERADVAAAELQAVWDAVDVQEKYKYDGLWEPGQFDAYRWLVARQILKLQEAVEDLR